MRLDPEWVRDTSLVLAVDHIGAPIVVHLIGGSLFG
jgi:hypothetical protein